ncbi:cytochrome bc1 complex cytochrome b subunit [Naumannella cuiyingiana]|uniref:Cytochrome bc1 complex cytochrome b subunit n=1 Tax=Naumannella cuiyingiana TaxID=1347891 RepID=A0A7Z0DB19_9ACTN|nr:cytochrome bc complex cytochrome b subunit [Naumannella cuiyingiana]NYI72031.1 ubiquinol-cytochrome c reductase cytochrome b subunit [Naumannella cuiyingiana]
MAKPSQRVEAPVDDAVPATSPKPKHPLQAGAGIATWADDRLGLAGLLKKNLRKIFPDHWSFLLGEIALYSFIILLLTGVFLTLWFKPSMSEIEYEGSYQLLRGLEMSEAYASTLNISFDIRGGLLMRQMHHWAAMLFLGAMTAHMLRIFFTGAFRKPRELNWLIGIGLLSMGIVEGFAGYSLPDDLLSGTGLRIADGLMRSVPIVGTWAEFLIFGGEYPGDIVIERFYMAHILLIPGLILGLITAHLALVVYHKHTQYPGPGRKETNVVGYPLFPVYMAKAGGFFFIVFGVTALMGAFMQINPLWTYGPYNPAEVTAGSQPDWYMGWLEGGLRIMPGWEWAWGWIGIIPPTTWSWNVFLPGVGLMGLLFTLLGAYPFIEQWITGDKRDHNILQYPWQAPTRTALGVAGMSVYGVFWMAGGNDILAIQFNLSLNFLTELFRILVFAAPIAAFIITRRICLGIQRRNAERVLHGGESGLMERSPDGEYHEAHVPISTDEAYTLTQAAEDRPVQAVEGTDERGVKRKKGGISKLRAAASRWYFADNVRKPTAAEIEAAHHHDEPEGHSDSGNGHHAVDGDGSDRSALESSKH